MDTSGNYIRNQFCSYEIALKLKELGFDEEVIATFNTEDKVLNVFAFSVPNKGIFERGFEKGWCIKAPLWQQVIDWFREKHDIHIVITVNPYSELYEVNGYKIYTNVNTILTCVSNQEVQTWTHYKAREQAILKAIELCKR